MSYVIYCRSGWVKVVSLTLPSASMLSWAAVTPGMKRWHNTTHHLDLDSQPWRRNQWRNDAAFPLISQLVLTSCLTASNNPSVLFLWARHPKNAARGFFSKLEQKLLWLKNELTTFQWSKVKVCRGAQPQCGKFMAMPAGIKKALFTNIQPSICIFIKWQVSLCTTGWSSFAPSYVQMSST